MGQTVVASLRASWDHTGRYFRYAARLLAALPCLVHLGCVAQEHARAIAARDRYRACLAEHANSRDMCSDLEQRYQAAVRDYEKGSHQAWGCDPAQDQCPTPR
jgi:hypothetical protein